MGDASSLVFVPAFNVGFARDASLKIYRFRRPATLNRTVKIHGLFSDGHTVAEIYGSFAQPGLQFRIDEALNQVFLTFSSRVELKETLDDVISVEMMC